MKKVKVQQMKNRNGNEVKNQFIIKTENSVFFQSYDSIIAKKENGKVILDQNYWDYSQTTGKYRNIFLNETKKETEKKLSDGIYQLDNLN
jgi:hypothetical protein